jgi:CheY-like chemotaxis protein
VDDEPTVRRAISDMVSRTGYEVESSKDPREALRRARERSYDVLITDLRMRHMSGLALAEEVRKASPRCLIFLLTAFVAEPEPELDFSSVDQILYKPITQRALGRAIERALSSRSPEPA